MLEKRLELINPKTHLTFARADAISNENWINDVLSLNLDSEETIRQIKNYNELKQGTIETFEIAGLGIPVIYLLDENHIPTENKKVQIFSGKYQGEDPIVFDINNLTVDEIESLKDPTMINNAFAYNSNVAVLSKLQDYLGANKDTKIGWSNEKKNLYVTIDNSLDERSIILQYELWVNNNLDISRLRMIKSSESYDLRFEMIMDKNNTNLISVSYMDYKIDYKFGNDGKISSVHSVGTGDKTNKEKLENLDQIENSGLISNIKSALIDKNSIISEYISDDKTSKFPMNLTIDYELLIKGLAKEINNSMMITK